MAMSESDRARLFAIRCRAKRGDHVTREQQEFLEDMFRRYPDEYKAMSRRVWEDTKPFGAQ